MWRGTADEALRDLACSAAPLICYFAGAYLLSGLALAVIGPPRLHAATARPVMSLVMFPVMVLGVGLTGLVLTAATAGRPGLRGLRARFTRPVALRWLAVTLVPPAASLVVLAALSTWVSPVYTPQFLVFGLAAGALAGLCEEVGWTGFAYPRMWHRLGWLPAAVLLGLLWGLWHLPVVDSLGAASPHGRWWPEFAAAFVAALVPLRVLIAWAYVHTGSLRLAQLTHASFTGFLVVVSPPRVTPAQEAFWYLLYAVALAVIAVIAVAAHRPGSSPDAAPHPSAGRGARLAA